METQNSVAVDLLMVVSVGPGGGTANSKWAHQGGSQKPALGIENEQRNDRHLGWGCGETPTGERGQFLSKSVLRSYEKFLKFQLAVFLFI